MRFSFLKVPFDRRVQTAAVATVVIFTFFCLFLWIAFMVVPTLWIFYIPYILLNLYIDKAHQRGGRPWPALRKLALWKHFNNYFPAQLIFDNDWADNADPNQQYVFALHPHGVGSVSAWANIISNGGGFYDKLPHLLSKLRVVTLPVNFFVPIWREYVLAMGLIDSNEESISSALKQNLSVAIVIGGAAEALDAIPNVDYRITLNNRRGFIRLAMKHGSAIVPVFSFGENDLFDQNKHPRIRKIQQAIKKLTGFSTPLFRGRGIFNYDFGMIPHRTPLTTVCGVPIPLKKNENPTQEDLDNVHQIYIRELKKLYYAHREKCGNADRELILI